MWGTLQFLFTHKTMDKTWVKLYRRAKDHDIITDPIAWTLFSWILMSVNRDTGSMKIGRLWLAERFKISASTIYKALKRLEKKYKLVTLVTDKVTIKYTVVTVLKWRFYQDGNISGNNQVTIKGISSNTIQEYKNKELRKESGFKNPILEDDYFQRLMKIRNPKDNAETLMKMNLESALNRKYADPKYQRDWVEARMTLRGAN